MRLFWCLKLLSVQVVFIVPLNLKVRCTSLANLSTSVLLLELVPEQIKPSVSQPQPANSDNGTSTATSTNNNAKRATASNQQPPPQQQQQEQQQQPQALPRYPREVPPRFRHQEHKQLLKRGQHFPVIAANLGSAVKVLNNQSESSAVTNQQPPNNGEVQNSKTQSGEKRPFLQDLFLVV